MDTHSTSRPEHPWPGPPRCTTTRVSQSARYTTTNPTPAARTGRLNTTAASISFMTRAGVVPSIVSNSSQTAVCVAEPTTHSQTIAPGARLRATRATSYKARQRLRRRDSHHDGAAPRASRCKPRRNITLLPQTSDVEAPAEPHDGANRDGDKQRDQTDDSQVQACEDAAIARCWADHRDHPPRSSPTSGWSVGDLPVQHRPAGAEARVGGESQPVADHAGRARYPYRCQFVTGPCL